MNLEIPGHFFPVPACHFHNALAPIEVYDHTLPVGSVEYLCHEQAVLIKPSGEHAPEEVALCPEDLCCAPHPGLGKVEPGLYDNGAPLSDTLFPGVDYRAEVFSGAPESETGYLGKVKVLGIHSGLGMQGKALSGQGQIP